MAEEGNRLLIVAGASCTGKTSLIQALKCGEYRELLSELGLEDRSVWTYLSNSKFQSQVRIDSSVLSDKKVLLLHYDLFAHFRDDSRYPRIRKLLKRFEHIDVLTLYAKPSSLFKRSRTRFWSQVLQAFRSPLSKGLKINRFVRQLSERRGAYTDDSHLLKLYEKWFNELEDQRVTNHWLLESSSFDYGPLLEYQPDSTVAMIRQYFSED